MSKVVFPATYNQVMPYLIIENAAGFIDFAQRVFSAECVMKHLRDEQTIMHAEIKIGDSIIMLADTTDQHGVRNAGLFVYVADANESYNKAIAAGAATITPLSSQPYGLSGGVIDPFGNTWWITQHI